MNNETALERLSSILEHDTWATFLDKTAYASFIQDVKEVVSLAKTNQVPSIDAMRFEAAKAVLNAELARQPCTLSDMFALVYFSVKTGDALIAELQKPKLNDNTPT